MRFPALLLAACLILAGCSDPKQDPDDGDDGPTGSGSNSTSRTGTGGSGTSNRAPSVTLAANASADDPLNVTFLLHANDADQDALTWTLVLGDNQSANGTMRRLAGNQTGNASTHAANHTHAYASAGVYNLTLTVSDGLASGNATLTLDLSGAGSSFAGFVASGTPILPCPQCTEAGANTGVGYRAGENEFDSFFAEIPPEAAGQPFTVDSTGGDPDLSFRTSCASSGTAVEAFGNAGPESGIVPEGALCALMWEFADPESTITLTIGTPPTA